MKKRIIYLLIFGLIVITLTSGLSMTGVSSSHSASCSGMVDAEEHNTETVYVTTARGTGAYVEISGNLCPLSVDRPSHIDRSLTELEKAVIAVEYGGEIIVEQHNSFGDVRNVNEENMMYEGAVIGRQESANGVLEDGKSFTIRGEDDGIAVLKSRPGESAPLVFADNENERVNVENIILAESDRALHIKSDSDVYLENIAIDSTIDSVKNSDSHILMEKSILDGQSRGSVVRTDSNYYPNSSSLSIEDIRETTSTEEIIRAPGSNTDIEDPDDFIFQRVNEPSDYNPVVAGSYSYSGPIIVDSTADNSNDDRIGTPFETLQGALTAASVRSSENSPVGSSVKGNVIRLVDGDYEGGSVDGRGNSIPHSLNIKGNENTIPTINSLSINYPGNYRVQNVEIENNITSAVSNVNVDASNVYWGDYSTRDAIINQKTLLSGSSSIQVSPWCEDENCENFRYNSFSNICVTYDGSKPLTNNCAGSGKGDIDISVMGLSGLQTNPSFVEGRLVVEKSQEVSDLITDVEIDVKQSSSDIDGNVRLRNGRILQSEGLQIDFSRILDISKANRRDIQFTPAISGTITVRNPSDTNTETFRFSTSLTGGDIRFSEAEDGSSDSDENNTNNDGVIQDDDISGIVDPQERFVSSFNAETIYDSNYYDETIPPVEITESGYVQTSKGEMLNFSNARVKNGRPATLRADGGFNFGFSFDTLPPARNHVLILEYAYQAQDTPFNNIELQIMDSSGQEIYTGRPESNTSIKPTVTGSAFEPGESTSQVSTKRLEIPLHTLEDSYIRDTGDIYVTLKNNNYIADEGAPVFLLYNMKIQSGEDTNVSVGKEPIPSDPIPGDIDVEVNVINADYNSEYDTYDVEPGQDLEFELIFQNRGDTAVTGTFDMDDIHHMDSGKFPGSNLFNGLDTETSKVLEDIEVELGTGSESTKVRTYSVDWQKEEFGLHNLRVYRSGDEELAGEGSVGFDTYVLQEATPKIVDINVPDEHVTHDNINSEITLQNVGDLSGEVTVNPSFGKWESEESIQLPEGDSRGEPSQNVTVSYRRSDHPAVSFPKFNRREYTTPSEVIPNEEFENSFLSFDDTSTHGSGTTTYYRPNAPFSTTKGVTNFVGRAFSNIDITDRSVQINGANSLTSTKTEGVELGRLKISDFQITTNPTTQGNTLENNPQSDQVTVLASAWPYSHPSLSQPKDVRPYVDYDTGTPTLSGYGTLFSSATQGSDPVNRGSLPINHHLIESTSQPTDDYLGHSFSTRNRICNDPKLYEDGGATMIPRGEATSSIVSNSFIAFSAQSCNDRNRLTEIQPLHFVGTTNASYITTDSNPSRGFGEKHTIYQHPNNVSLRGVNPQTFEDVEEDSTAMLASVRISNPVDTQHVVTARIEIVSNRTTSDIVGIGGPDGLSVEAGSPRFDRNVVGAAAVRMYPQEEKQFKVPIVIRNNPNNTGVHELTVRTRATAEGTGDYIEKGVDTGSSGPLLTTSPITGKEYDRFTVPIIVEGYGDAVLDSVEPAPSMSSTTSSDNPYDAQLSDAVAYEVCDSTEAGSMHGSADSRRFITDNYNYTGNGTYSPDRVEGLNPTSASNYEGFVRDYGQCSEDVPEEDELVEFDATYTNYGAESIEIEPDAIWEKVTQSYQSRIHRQNAHATADRFVADYINDTQSTFDGPIDANVTLLSEGRELTPGETIELQPEESKTIRFARRFQEPGLYQIHVSPCRDISGSGPQQYNLEGYSASPDTYSVSSGVDYTNRVKTAVSGVNRINRGSYNAHSTEEVENSVFHNSAGCQRKVGSVFVYDITDPVADFRPAEDRTAIKKPDLTQYTSNLTRSVPEDTEARPVVHTGVGYNKSASLKVYEGGIIMFDSSTFDCNNCYKTPLLSPEFGVRNASTRITDGFLRNSRILDSSDRANVTGINQYPLSQENAIITDMNWSIDGIQPNYGNISADGVGPVCSEVNRSSLYQACYLEVFSGDNDYEVIAHRFTRPGNRTIELTVKDDTRFTKGEANINRTTKEIEVIENDPINDSQVNLSAYAAYDLSYGHPWPNSTVSGINSLQPDKLGDRTTDRHIWHRNEQVIRYRGTPANFQSEYRNVYEGTRVCLLSSVNQSEENIGVSQEIWRNVDNSGTIPLNGTSLGGRGDLDTDYTIPGDRKCLVFKEQPNSVHTFEYEAFDYGLSSGEDDVDVEVTKSGSDITMEHRSNHVNKRYHEPETENYVYAADTETSFTGGGIGFHTSAIESYSQSDLHNPSQDNDVGIACLDHRAISVTDTNCQAMDGGTNLAQGIELDFSSGLPLIGRVSSDLALQAGSGPWNSETANGIDSVAGIGWFESGPWSEFHPYEATAVWNDAYTAEDLNVYANGTYSNPGVPSRSLSYSGAQNISFSVVGTDWHSHTSKKTTSVNVAVDKEDPQINVWEVKVNGVNNNTAWVGGKGDFQGSDVKYESEGVENGPDSIEPVGFYQLRPDWGSSGYHTTIGETSGNADMINLGPRGSAVVGAARGAREYEISKELKAQEWGYEYTFEGTVTYEIVIEDLHSNTDKNTTDVNWERNDADDKPNATLTVPECTTTDQETNKCWSAGVHGEFDGAQATIKLQGDSESPELNGERVGLYRWAMLLNGASNAEEILSGNPISVTETRERTARDFGIVKSDTTETINAEVEGQHARIGEDDAEIDFKVDNSQPKMDCDAVENTMVGPQPRCGGIERTYDAPNGTSPSELNPSITFTVPYEADGTNVYDYEISNQGIGNAYITGFDEGSSGGTFQLVITGFEGGWSTTPQPDPNPSEPTVEPPENPPNPCNLPPGECKQKCNTANSSAKDCDTDTSTIDGRVIVEIVDYHGNKKSEIFDWEAKVIDEECEIENKTAKACTSQSCADECTNGNNSSSSTASFSTDPPSSEGMAGNSLKSSFLPDTDWIARYNDFSIDFDPKLHVKEFAEYGLNLYSVGNMIL
jgi:hypothetical protein